MKLSKAMTLCSTCGDMSKKEKKRIDKASKKINQEKRRLEKLFINNDPSFKMDKYLKICQSNIWTHYFPTQISAYIHDTTIKSYQITKVGYSKGEDYDY